MPAMETLSHARGAPPTGGWQFWIDRGGTFTDVVGLAPDGALHIRKVLSVPAGDAVDADPGLSAAREIQAAVAPAAPVTEVKVGTTVATNALLTRTGEPVVLVTTAGFAAPTSLRATSCCRHGCMRA
jgi:5-oxoprolinase (ATP-hydrolysing)